MNNSKICNVCGLPKHRSEFEKINHNTCQECRSRTSAKRISRKRVLMRELKEAAKLCKEWYKENGKEYPKTVL